MKKKILFLLKVLVGLGILYWVLSTANIEFSEINFSDLQIEWVFPLLVLAFSQVLLQSLRWKVLYGPGSSPQFSEFMKYIFIGYFFSVVLPWTLGGDAVKAIAFGKRHNGLLRSSAAILLGRILGVTALFLFFVVAYYSFGFSLDKQVVVTLSSITALLMGSIALFMVAPQFILSRMGSTGKAHKALEAMTFLSHKRLLLGSILTIALQLCVILNLYVAFKLVGAAITLPIALFYFPLTILLLFLPISFSGIGIREASFTFFLTPFSGIAAKHCLEASVVNYIVLFSYALIGFIFFFVNKKENSQKE